MKDYIQRIIDDAKKHFRANYPDDLPIEKAYFHIGLYIAWVIEHGLYSKKFHDEFATQIQRFFNRDTSCIILGELWDGFVFYEQFNAEGKEFAAYYYESGMYFKDFVEILAPDLRTMYEVEDSWENYDIMRERINARYAEWKQKTGRQ